MLDVIFGVKDHLDLRPLTRRRLAKVWTLLQIWSSAGVVTFVAFMLIYTWFFGWNKVTLNESIYQGMRLVGYPGASQFATDEGYGLTMYGENGLIVNKQVRDDVTRVLFVGDSFVKAKQVDDHEKFTELVEEWWNDTHPDKPIQALNIGLGDQNMATYLSFGKQMDAVYQPHLVFVMVTETDFNHLTPQQLESLPSGIEQPLVRAQRTSPLHEFINAIGVRSFFGQLQSQGFGLMSGGETIVVEAASLDMNRPDEAAERDRFTIQMEALQRIWEDRLVMIYRKGIADMGRNAPAQNEDNAFLRIQESGIPVIDLYPPFLDAFQEHRPPQGFNNSILGDGHPNRYGHQIIAGEIIHFMEQQTICRTDDRSEENVAERHLPSCLWQTE